MFSAGRVGPAVPRAPEAEAPVGEVLPQFTALISFRTSVPPTQLPTAGNLAPALAPGMNTNTLGDVNSQLERTRTLGLEFGSTIGSATSRHKSFGVDIAPPGWLPVALHADYFAAWNRVIEEKLAYTEENPLTWLGITEPRKFYGSFPNHAAFKQFFELEANALAERFKIRAQEHRAGECFVSVEEQEIFRQAFGDPQFHISAKWRDALRGADADLTPSSEESLKRKMEQHQKFLDDAELMRRPDEDVFEWSFRVQQVITQRAFAKAASEYKLNGALGAVMSAGGTTALALSAQTAEELEKLNVARAALQKLGSTVAYYVRSSQDPEGTVLPRSERERFQEKLAELTALLNTYSRGNSWFDWERPLAPLIVALRQNILPLEQGLDYLANLSGDDLLSGEDLAALSSELEELFSERIDDPRDGLGFPHGGTVGARDLARQLVIEWGRPTSHDAATGEFGWNHAVELGSPKVQVILSALNAEVVLQSDDSIRLRLPMAPEAELVDITAHTAAAPLPPPLDRALQAMQRAHTAFSGGQRDVDVELFQIAAAQAQTAEESFVEAGHFEQALKAAELRAQALVAQIFQTPASYSSDAPAALQSLQENAERVLNAMRAQSESFQTLRDTRAVASFNATLRDVAQILTRLGKNLANIEDSVLRSHAYRFYASLMKLVAVWQQRSHERWYVRDVFEVFARLTDATSEVLRIQTELQALLGTDGRTAAAYRAENETRYHDKLKAMKLRADASSVSLAAGQSRDNQVEQVRLLRLSIQLAEQARELFSRAGEQAEADEIIGSIAGRQARLAALERAKNNTAQSFDPEQMTGMALSSWRRAEQLQQRGRKELALGFYKLVLEELRNAGDSAGVDFVAARIAELEAEQAK